jgi:hypothetical protein
MLAPPAPPETTVTHDGAPVTAHAQDAPALRDMVLVPPAYPKNWLAGESVAPAHGLPAWLTENELSAMLSVAPRPELVVFSTAEYVTVPSPWPCVPDVIVIQLGVLATRQPQAGV